MKEYRRLKREVKRANEIGGEREREIYRKTRKCFERTIMKSEKEIMEYHFP